MKFFNLLLFALSIQIASQAQAVDLEQQCLFEKTKSDIIDKLSCLQGVIAVEATTPLSPKGTRQFEMTIEQPIDHNNAKRGTFRQRLALIHRNDNEPMVLQTSGYSIFSVRESVITKMFQTNQIQIEHRYFSNSIPDANEVDWSYLNIKQSADDFHNVVTKFKKIYSGPWVNTGASKGGMTSIYHRRFYPNDLVGTVSDVAPHSYTRADQRYNDFINSVGGDDYKACRDGFKSMQYNVLKNREQFLPQISGDFSHLGDKSVAFEHAVIESVFYFWQYGNADDPDRGCIAVPVNGTLQRQFEFLTSLAALEDYTDEKLNQFMPYFYQAATQLGGPDNYTAHLEPLRLFEFRVEQYTPKGVALPYSNAAMLDVENWLRQEADQVVMIYGAFDPWTAGEMPTSNTGKFVKKYFVPKGNHGAKYINLVPEERSEVVEILKGWLKKDPAVQPLQILRSRKASDKTLEDFEFEYRKRHRL